MFQSAPPVRGATDAKAASAARVKFQSAPPVRGATGPQVDRLPEGPVSIRAPRAGGDKIEQRETAAIGRFNPRPPCGGRHDVEERLGRFDPFQSAPPVRGATPEGLHRAVPIAVSIRAPRAGGDESGRQAVSVEVSPESLK